MRVYQDFFCYPDPNQRFLRQNDTNPTGSGSETLIYIIYFHNLGHKNQRGGGGRYGYGRNGRYLRG